MLVIISIIHFKTTKWDIGYNTIKLIIFKFSIFKKMFKEYLDIIKNDDVKKYVLSKFSFSRQHLLDNISLVLQIDSQYSIIDLYNDLETIIPIYYYDFFTRGRGEVLLINKLGIKSKLAQNINLIYDINANQELVVYRFLKILK